MTIFASDTFTGTASSTLQSHTSDSGHTWTKNGGNQDNVLDSTGSRLIGTYPPTTFQQYYLSATPPSATQYVQADINVTSTGRVSNGIGGRLTTTANADGYYVNYTGGAWTLFKRVSGSNTTLGTYASSTTGVATVKLVLNGTSISVFVNGTSVISATDSSISAAGKVGVFNYYTDPGDSDYLDNFLASDTDIVPAPVLSSPGADTITATGARITASSSVGTGTFYVAVSTSSTAPTAAQIKAGSGGSIVAAASSTLASGANAASVTGLTSSTTYYGYAVANNGSDSNVVATGSFTTLSTAPVLQSSVINAAGTTLTDTYSVSTSIGAGGNGGKTLTMSGGAVTATYQSGAPGTALVYSLSRVITSAETGTSGYTQPGNGLVNTADSANVVTYSGFAVTNNSTQVGPGISSLSTSTPANGSSLTITGTNFLATQGAGSVTIGGVAQTVTAWSNTSITVTVARGTNQYGTNLAVQVTNNSALASNTSTVQITPQSGWAFTNLGTPNATSTNRITAVADLVSGDQLAYDTKSGMVIVYSDATFSADSSVANFSVEAWSSGNGWGSAATQTLSAGAVVTARIVGILSLF